MRIVFRVDAGVVPEIGTGHMVRSIELARAVEERLREQDLEVVFATRSGERFERGRALAAEAGIPCVVAAGLEPNTQSELELLLSLRADVVVMDRLATSAALIQGLRESGSLACTFDDLGTGRQHADIAVNALLQGVAPAENRYVGYDYLILPQRTAKPRQPREGVSRVLTCFGGHDGRGLSGLVLDAVQEIQSPLEFDVVVGDVNSAVWSGYESKVRSIREKTGHVVHIHSRVDLSPFLEASDVAIVSGGILAFEVAHVGLPAIGLPQYEHQLENLDRLQKAGCLKMVEQGMDVTASGIAASLDILIADAALRSHMSRVGRQLIDGGGLARVTEILVRAISDAGSSHVL